MVNLFQENQTLDYFNNQAEDERQNQLNIVNNFVTPEFIQQEQQKGKITALETLKNAKKWGYAVPFVGTTAETVANANILKINR